jgi:hypothetical protein
MYIMQYPLSIELARTYWEEREETGVVFEVLCRNLAGETKESHWTTDLEAKMQTGDYVTIRRIWPGR